MLISHGSAFVYIKTNKTASTSIEMALQPYCQEDPDQPVAEKTHARASAAGIIGQRLIPKNEATALDREWYNHMPAAEVHEKIGDDRWDAYTKIHAIRNPFDKVVSSFFWKSSLRGLRYETLADARADFEDYALHQDWKTDYEILHIDCRYCGDIAIRYENLADDLQRAARLIGLDESRLVLPHTKKTASLRMGEDMAAFYTPPAIARVLERCDWIFERFGYPSDPGDAGTSG